MSLSPGSRLGVYEILAPLGAGGMGEVYKARDTRLDRTVAIKVLPASFASDSSFRQRFEREARAISAIEHPNICPLYDVGSDIDFLVMQHLSGETLAERLARRALTVEDICLFGAQIADALAAAHRRGIVHRDLKPGNVMLTRDGVRLLDFGLAKQSAPMTTSDATSTRTMPLTGERTIIGTLQYMAPEQLEAGNVDARTDVFALGTVLYEMITGRRAFEGDSPASLITAIMTGRRTPIAAPPAPPALSRLIDRCLCTSPDDRWQSASDLAYELRSIRELPAGGAATTTPRRGLNAWWLIGGVAAILAAIAMGTLLRPRAERPPVNELRLSVVPPDGYEFAGDAADFDPDFDVSPDGRQLVFAAMNRAGKRTLWVRDLGTTAARELADTDGAHRPFWSPDGRSVGFTASAGMTRVAIDGASSPKAIGSMLAGDRNTSASWGSKGQIIFDATTREGAASGAKKLFTIPESGGKTEPVPRGNPPPDEQRSAIPCFSATVGTFFI